jgi:hypothetical protein
LAADLLQEIGKKKLAKEDLLALVEKDFGLIAKVLDGTNSPEASIRYGCGKILTDLSEKHPEKLYPYIDRIIELLDSKYRILTWNAIVSIANLTKVDHEKRFDAIFRKYYDFLDSEYIVTVANVVGNSGRIAVAKPYLVQDIARELLKVEGLSTTPHLTEECKRVIMEYAIQSFEAFFDKVKDKPRVLSFVERQVASPRKSLAKKASNFLEKWT